MTVTTTDRFPYTLPTQSKPASDLGTPDEIAVLARAFCAQVAEDELLRPIFVDQAAINWDHQIQQLTRFWSEIALGIPGYQGSPIQKHSAISAVIPFRNEHFTRWIQIFQDTIDRHWVGFYAELIKARAVNIAKAQSRNVLNAERWDDAALISETARLL